MPDVPALFNSACCCAVRMPIPHGVSFAVQLLMEAQNRSNLLSAQFPAKSLRALPGKTASHFSGNCPGLLLAQFPAKPLRALPGIALAVQICRSFTYMQF
ncbi:hypothetical protein GR247_30450 [Rhizobium leguminosarum]|uniref:Uncharacterized protein n=1 Tax=Rhizobium ruizarguesonis TaxID=2081791 RepID=A0AB38I3C7_9HYPH|nr:hypothetical protein [Rhizobium ruizarguesonis]NEJ24439.1 hypothetical protein [Rhizobium leguminosarum]TBC15138.1 hypothetical protein ELH40_09465 [Rhizobium ruizarguesonis]